MAMPPILVGVVASVICHFSPVCQESLQMMIVCCFARPMEQGQCGIELVGSTYYHVDQHPVPVRIIGGLRIPVVIREGKFAEQVSHRRQLVIRHI